MHLLWFFWRHHHHCQGKEQETEKGLELGKGQGLGKGLQLEQPTLIKLPVQQHPLRKSQTCR